MPDNNNHNNTKHAYLIDSSIYIFRGWHVCDEDIVYSEGNLSNAVYGFTEFLRELLELEQPEYIACTGRTEKPSSNIAVTSVGQPALQISPAIVLKVTRDLGSE